MIKIKKILNEDVSDIYGNGIKDDYLVPDEIVIPKPDLVNVNMVNKGLITTMNINGKNVDFVSPQYIGETQRIIATLADKIYKLEIRSSMLNNNINNLIRQLTNINRRVDGKIDRE
jgi:hypothetical protein